MYRKIDTATGVIIIMMTVLILTGGPPCCTRSKIILCGLKDIEDKLATLQNWGVEEGRRAVELDWLEKQYAIIILKNVFLIIHSGVPLDVKRTLHMAPEKSRTSGGLPIPM